MSLNYVRSVRCLSLVTKHYPNVCPHFHHKCGPNRGLKSISTTIKSRNWFKTKVLDSNHSINYSNDAKSSLKCWKCGQQSNEWKVFLICDNCHSIQAIDRSLNYFDLFEQKLSFDLDLNKLNQRFKSLQMLSHPDKYVMSSHIQRKYSTDNSLLINKAYKTLRDPYERGLYLLKLSNTYIHENQSFGESGIDSQFLTNIMKLNEDIEENCESKEKLLNIFNENKHKMNELMEQMSEAFSCHQIIRAKELLSKFKFLITLDSHLKQKLQIFE